MKVGNKQAELSRLYLNNRFNADLIDFCGSKRDRSDMEDYGNDKYSFQCKIRHSGADIIFETDQFIPEYTPEYVIRHEPGRDSRTIANFYICKPKNENKFVITKPEIVREMISNTRLAFGYPVIKKNAYNGKECDLIDLPTEKVKEWWQKARDGWTRSIKVFELNSTEVWFKIEEGDSKKYGKILFFIPPLSVKGKILEMKDGESFEDPATWKATENEKLEDYLL